MGTGPSQLFKAHTGSRKSSEQQGFCSLQTALLLHVFLPPYRWLDVLLPIQLGLWLPPLPPALLCLRISFQVLIQVAF